MGIKPQVSQINMVDFGANFGDEFRKLVTPYK